VSVLQLSGPVPTICALRGDILSRYNLLYGVGASELLTIRLEEGIVRLQWSSSPVNITEGRILPFIIKEELDAGRAESASGGRQL
jgi:hypothetical protein